jgi:hypothetical protein
VGSGPLSEEQRPIAICVKAERGADYSLRSRVRLQELFIFKKDADGKWRIGRYSFSTTNPM